MPGLVMDPLASQVRQDYALKIAETIVHWERAPPIYRSVDNPFCAPTSKLHLHKELEKKYKKKKRASKFKKIEKQEKKYYD